jgi:hypothetical protein
MNVEDSELVDFEACRLLSIYRWKEINVFIFGDEQAESSGLLLSCVE